MSSFASTLHSFNGSLLRSQFLGQDHHHNLNHHHFPLKHPQNKPGFDQLQPHAKFNLLEIMGGRGICNGEKGIQLELERKVAQTQQQQQPHEEEDSEKEEQENSSGDGGGVEVSDDAFEKEMMGLTGGFPGGEKGLLKFIEENPPCSNQGTLVTISERKEAKAVG